MPSVRAFLFAAAALLLAALLAASAGAELLVAEGTAFLLAALLAIGAFGAVAGALAASHPGAGNDPPPRAGAAFTRLGAALANGTEIAVYLIDRSGTIVWFGPGAERLFGISAAEAVGRLALETVLTPAEALEMPAELHRVFETGRSHAPRRAATRSRDGTRREVTVALLPVRSEGHVETIAVVHVDTGVHATGEERRARLADHSPAGLLALDAEGRIESANARFADWTGRRADLLPGLDVSALEMFPEPFRGRLAALGAASRGLAAPPATIEEDVEALTGAGGSRTLRVVATTRPLGGVDAVFTDAAAWRRLLAERDAARDALREARETARGPSPARGGRDGATRVLLVEDNDANRELLSHMLRARGAEVTEAASGRVALDAAASTRFDLVLLDLQMPEMDGFQTARRLRALAGGDETAIVALTALTSPEMKERCLAEGMDDFAGKPLTFGRMREILDRWGHGVPPSPG